jgi:hypothetical protein
MPDFLTNVLAGGPLVSSATILLRLVAALTMGFVVSWIYRFTRDKDSIAPSFPTTLILLSVLIAMVTEVIGDSVARAFSLVGALSIVRFRTVVRDTQDTAYVMFAVIVGMAMGANNLWIALIGITVVATAALLTMSRGQISANGTAIQPDFLLSVLVGLGTDLQTLTPVCDRHIGKRLLRSFRTVRQGAALEAVYEVKMREGASAVELVRALNQRDGVQSVEIQRPGVFEE